MNTIIVEAGSSKSDWVLLQDDKIILNFTTSGINPTTQSKGNILSVVEIASQNFTTYKIQNIYFYGAGCKGVGQSMMAEILQYCFSESNISAESDLLAAARSSCSGSEGIVAILGTGSHSCLSDGHKIIHERPALGYLLGDEGSGNYYGKEILKAYFYNQMDEELLLAFENDYPFIKNSYLSNLYSSPRVSFELAQYFPFLLKNRNNILIKEILNEGMNSFYNSRILQYNVYKHLPIYINGSVGQQLKEEYIIFLSNEGYQKINFNAKPIQGLIQYHSTYA